MSIEADSLSSINSGGGSVGDGLRGRYSFDKGGLEGQLAHSTSALRKNLGISLLDQSLQFSPNQELGGLSGDFGKLSSVNSAHSPGFANSLNAPSSLNDFSSSHGRATSNLNAAAAPQVIAFSQQSMLAGFMGGLGANAGLGADAGLGASDKNNTSLFRVAVQAQPPPITATAAAPAPQKELVIELKQENGGDVVPGKQQRPLPPTITVAQQEAITNAALRHSIMQLQQQGASTPASLSEFVALASSNSNGTSPSAQAAAFLQPQQAAGMIPPSPTALGTPQTLEQFMSSPLFALNSMSSQHSLTDHKKKRLARKAELARASRRRKKAYVKQLEDKFNALTAQVAHLERELAQKPEVPLPIASSDGNEGCGLGRKKNCIPKNELMALRVDVMTDAEVRMLNEVHSFDRGLATKQTSAIIDKIHRCTVPGTQAKFAMWMLEQDDSFYQGGGLWESLATSELKLNPEQKEAIKGMREAMKQSRRQLSASKIHIQQLRDHINNHIKLFGEMASDFNSICHPRHLAKFHLWVHNNDWVVHMLNTMWPTALAGDMAVNDADKGTYPNSVGAASMASSNLSSLSSVGSSVQSNAGVLHDLISLDNRAPMPGIPGRRGH